MEVSEVGYKKPPKHSQFKPGNKASKGGVKLPKEFKEIRALTKDSFKHLVEALAGNDLVALEKAYKEGTVLERWISSIMLNSIKKGDMTSLNLLLPWLIGKVPDKIDASLTVINPFKDMDHDKKIEMAKEVVELLERQKK